MRRVGQLLAYEGHSYAIVVLGGAALNLLGIVERPTSDVDILAFAGPNKDDATNSGSLRSRCQSRYGVRAIREVARDMRLEEDWLNVGPALQWRAGLPAWLAGRVHWRPYDTLSVGLVDRYDLIFFKLFAAADSPRPDSVHYRDLLALGPTVEELDAAAKWVRAKYAAPEFGQVLDKVLIHVRRDLGFDDAYHTGRDR